MTNAALDPNREANDEIVALAQHLDDENDQRVDKMTDLLLDWGEPRNPPTDDLATALAGTTGVVFDEQWTALMIEHHEQAIEFVERVQDGGSNRIVDNLASGMLIDLGFEMTSLASG